jgi:hypothetical protein
VVVVSFIGALPFSLVGRRSVGPDRRTDLIGRSKSVLQVVLCDIRTRAARCHTMSAHAYCIGG